MQRGRPSLSADYATSIIDRLEEVGRDRALTDDETRKLQQAVSSLYPAGTYRRWDMKDNADLLTASRVRGGLKRYAEQSGRTYASCQRQLDRLKQTRRRRGIATVGRFFYDGEIGGE